MQLHFNDPQYRAILEAMPDGIYIVDRNLRINYVNSSIRRMIERFGISSNILGRIFTEAFPFATDYLEREVEQVFETREPMEAENILTINGQTVISLARRIPLKNDQGVLFAVLNVVRDVTQERANVRDLAKAKTLFEEMVEDSGSIMLKMDPQGRVTYWNRYAEQFFGFTRAELLGKSVVGTIVPELETTGRDLAELMKALAADPTRFAQNENENLRKDGSRVWVHWSNRPIFDAEGKLIELFCVGQDITAVKNAQAESEERYRYLFHESPAGSAILSTDGRIVDINAAFLRAFGYTREEILNRPASDFIVGETRKLLSEVLPQRFAGVNVPPRENQVLAKDGSIRSIVFAGGQALIRGKDGRVTGILLCGEDVTEQRHAAQAEVRHREELMRADRMASLGTLVSGIAHEINNPNNFIILNADNLKDIWNDILPVLDRNAAENPEFRIVGLPYPEVRKETGRLIQGLTEGARRIKTIVQHLKDFARQAPSDMEQRVDLNKVVEAATTILGALIRKSTDSFHFEPGRPAAFVKGDFQKLEQVVINLISNACQALERKSAAITVRTSLEADDGMVRLTVADQGKGIPKEVLTHIFDPFFTTKRDQGGTGLGLSISYGIAEDHGGRLTVESTVGTGTAFTLELPAVGGSEAI